MEKGVNISMVFDEGVYQTVNSFPVFSLLNWIFSYFFHLLFSGFIHALQYPNIDPARGDTTWCHARRSKNWGKL